MNAAQRDEMLIRIDQKVRDSLPAIVEHLERINGHLEDHSRRITVSETLQKERNKTSKKTITGYTSAVIAIVIALWKAFTDTP